MLIRRGNLWLMPLDLLHILFIVASKPAPEKSPQRTTAKISLAKGHSCAGVVRVRFMDRKERGLTGVRMRPARRVHRVLLDRACDGGERIIGVAADQTNRADNEYQDYSQHHRIFRDVLPLVRPSKA